MKHADIQKIHEAGLITQEQRRAIIDHFHLREDTQHFLAVLSLVGAVLVSAGIILLVSANWDEIPDAAKIAGGLGLLVGAHAAGWWLRDRPGRYPRAGEALYVVGALLFLANIALLGQIYNLSSRLPNAFLVWLLGIAPLPWILRSRPLHVLSLFALGIWFGTETWEGTGWLAFGGRGYPLMLLALLGLLVYGLGAALRPTEWNLFSRDSERLGLLAFGGALFPFTLGPFHEDGLVRFEDGSRLPFVVMAVLAFALLAWALPRDSRWAPQWRWTWLATLAGLVLFLGVVLAIGADQTRVAGDAWHGTALSWIGTVLVFAFALVQVRIGVHLAEARFVNQGVALVGLVILATYLTLIGSMGQTGFVFIVSGVFLIAFGIYLEKQRRKLLGRIRPTEA